jgi:hypothetical protein
MIEIRTWVDRFFLHGRYDGLLDSFPESLQRLCRPVPCTKFEASVTCMIPSSKSAWLIDLTVVNIAVDSTAANVAALPPMEGKVWLLV